MMASMANYNDARTWLLDWLVLAEEGSNRAKRFIVDGAREQRANLEAVKRNGSSWCENVEEYERAVVMIEAAAKQLTLNGTGDGNDNHAH